MRWLCTLLMFALLTLPVAAGADELATSAQKRTILMSEDYIALERSYSILKMLGERFNVEYRYVKKRGKYDKIKIRIHLYEFSPNKNGVRHRLELLPQIGNQPGLTFIYRF